MLENVSSTETSVAQSTLFKSVYTWMAAALALTGVTALMVYTSDSIFNAVLSLGYGIWVLFLIELGLVWFISSRINSISFKTALGLFMIYSIINGVVLSIIFAVYTASSIASTFFVTAGTFGAMSLFGYFTKKDLSKMGSILYMLLIGLIIATVVNIFWANSTLYWITTYAGVLIFVGLTAYDTQKIKNLLANAENNEENQKLAVLGALSLYLDFINLFLYLLRILGSRK